MKTLTVVVSLTMLCSTVWAGPLQTARIAGDAKWAVHVDFEEMINSETGKFVISEAEQKEQFQAKIAGCQELFGFNPLTDLRGVTLYGKEFRPDPASACAKTDCGRRCKPKPSGVAVIDGTADQQKLLALVQMSEYKELRYGDHVVHEWTAPSGRCKTPQTKFGCFYSRDRIVVASSLELLQGALEVLDGKTDSMAKTKSLSALSEPAKGAWLIAAAEGFEVPQTGPPHAAMLKSLTGGSFRMGEADGAVYATLTMTAKSEEEAAVIRQAMQGYVAIMQMIKAQQPIPELQELGEEMSIGGADGKIECELTIPVDGLVKLIPVMIERGREMRAAHMR